MKKLEIGNFLVRDIVFGEKTAYEGGILTVNREEATKAINPLGKLKKALNFTSSIPETV